MKKLLLLTCLFTLILYSENAMGSTTTDFIREQQAAGHRANGLIHEKSPYLLQHAFNPVSWLPWGEEAFKRAREQEKPIFLSIGYSTCHWCHVMAHESFENEEIAQYLNEHFICIKVDREERPDIDALYMAATQAMTGSGGWPMSVFLMPDLKPFYAGTYFPPKTNHGKPGFLDLLHSIGKLWDKDRDKLRESAQNITDELVRQNTSATTKGEVNADVIHHAFKQMEAAYDPKFGGIGTAPKFPRPTMYHQLFRYYHREKNSLAKNMVLHSLREMASGGMYDQLGGGFHRYSVDDQWRVPHFEKMLYDQAGLATLYTEAYQVSGDAFFLHIAEEILTYVLRDMTSPEGGFYSAEDADSTAKENKKIHGEGLFYIWDYDEINTILGEDDGSIFNYIYGVRVGGNALHDPLGEFHYKNILFQEHSFTEAATKFEISPMDVQRICTKAETILFKVRAQRPRPHLDDKIITAWNGLMISALAKGYQVTENATYLEAASTCAAFISTNLMQDHFTLLRRYREGEAHFDGQLNDYAFFIQGLLDLYEASFEVRWLQLALNLQEQQNKVFGDQQGGFFDTSGLDHSVILRLKEDYDGAEPSGNSVSAMNLLRLAQLTGTEDYTDQAMALFGVFSEGLNRSPLGRPNLVSALDFSTSKPMQIILVGDPKQDDAKQLLAVIHNTYLPTAITIMATPESRDFFEPRMATFAYLTKMEDKATAYVCENFTCEKPVNTPSELQAILHQK